MNIDDMFPSNYIKTEDLKGKKSKPMTIVSIDEEEIGDRDRAVLHFVGTPKGLPLNKTNAEALAAVLGKDTSKWVGAKVVLMPDKTLYQGKRVDCTRIADVTPPKGFEKSDDAPPADDDTPF